MFFIALKRLESRAKKFLRELSLQWLPLTPIQSVLHALIHTMLKL